MTLRRSRVLSGAVEAPELASRSSSPRAKMYLRCDLAHLGYHKSAGTSVSIRTVWRGPGPITQHGHPSFITSAKPSHTWY
jgi:hypothetical protein